MKEKLKSWVITHDEKTLFTILYIGLSVVLSIYISLFWLVVIVGIHALMEYISLKYKNTENILFELFDHMKLDFALITFALFLSIYMEAVFGLLIAKYGTRFASFIAYQNTFRAILMSLDDLAQAIKALFSIKNKNKTPLEIRSEKVSKKNTTSDYIVFILLFSSIIGILFSPYILDMEVMDIIKKLSLELTPFPKN